MIPTSSLYLGHDADTDERLYLPASARQNSVHVIGQPGQGKSKFLEHLIRQDIENGEGMCLIDPHGSVFGPIAKWCAANGYFDLRRVLVLDVARDGWSFGFNPLAYHDGTADGVLSVVDSMVNATSQAWGGENLDDKPTISHVLPAIYQLLGERGLTIAETSTLIRRGPVLETVVAKVADENLKEKWVEFLNAPPVKWHEEVVGPRNRLSRFTDDSRIRCILGQTEPLLDFRSLMDEQTVLLVNLAGLQPQRKRLLGSLLVSSIYTAALQRQADRGPAYHVYIDEAHLYVNQDIEHLIEEGRKFGVWLVLAHQNLAQLRREGGDAVFSAVMLLGTKVVFGGLPHEDTEYLACELWSGFTDYEVPKETFTRPAVVGQKLVTLSGWQSGSATSSGRSAGTSQGTGDALAYDHATTFGRPEHVTSSTSHQYVSTNLETSGFASSQSYSEHEAMVPIYEDLPIALYSLAELRDRQAGILKRQATQQAVVQVLDGCPYHLKVPFVEDPLITDTYVGERLERAIEETPFAIPRAKAERSVRERREKLEREAERAIRDMEPDPDDFLE